MPQQTFSRTPSHFSGGRSIESFSSGPRDDFGAQPERIGIFASPGRPIATGGFSARRKPQGSQAGLFLEEKLQELTRTDPTLPSAAEINRIDMFDGDRITTFEALMDNILRGSSDIEFLDTPTLLDLHKQFSDLLDGRLHFSGAIALPDGQRLNSAQVNKLRDVVELFEDELEDRQQEELARQLAEQKNNEGGGGAMSGSPSGSPPGVPSGGGGGGAPRAQMPQFPETPPASLESFMTQGQNLAGVLSALASAKRVDPFSEMARFFSQSNQAEPPPVGTLDLSFLESFQAGLVASVRAAMLWRYQQPPINVTPNGLLTGDPRAMSFNTRFGVSGRSRSPSIRYPNGISTFSRARTPIPRPNR